jgi:hypothetical protein
MAIPEGVSKVKPATPAHVPITIRTNKVRYIVFYPLERRKEG